MIKTNVKKILKNRPMEWYGPFSAHNTTIGWVIEGGIGLIILERLTESEAKILVYALNNTLKENLDAK